VAAVYYVLFGRQSRRAPFVVDEQPPDRVRDLALVRALTSCRTRFRELSSRGLSE
jgi:hypothetical protein